MSPKSREQIEWEESVTEDRLKKQLENEDYNYIENGEKEKCSDCGTFINSDDHCPLCDY